MAQSGAIAVFGAIFPAWAQPAKFQIPDGARHFIVLVDSGTSIVGGSHFPVPADTKRKNLAAAKRELAEILYSPNRGQAEPWYRPGRDRISVVQYGIDTRPHAELAPSRLKNARLDDDYARRIIHAERRLSRNRFLAALTPRKRTHLSILPWAIPLGLSAAAVPTYSIQETYVILLNDAPSNDGLLSVQNSRASDRLNSAARQRLAQTQKIAKDSLTLVGKNGTNGPWLEQRFGEGANSVVFTFFKAEPKTTVYRAAELARLHPLDNLTLEPSGIGIRATMDPDKILIGKTAQFRLDEPKRAEIVTTTLAPRTSLHLSDLGGMLGKASLVVTDSVPNLLLGKQQFQISYARSVVLLAGRRAEAAIQWICFALAASAIGIWAYVQAVLARHFQLWLPGYVTSFRLPPIAQKVASRHVLRLPVEVGELAAILILPSPLIRWIFYRNATLAWDSKLVVIGAPGDRHSAKLTELRTLTKFVCQQRPPTSGEFEFTIERPTKKGGNQRAKINVRFLSLPSAVQSTLE